jgi:hypothetical protein
MKRNAMPAAPGSTGSSSQRRVLARVLAEELANVRVCGAGLTSVVTEPPVDGGRKDITNLTGDNDGNEY